MRISAKADYAVRACLELAVRSPSRSAGPTKGEVLGEEVDGDERSDDPGPPALPPTGLAPS